MTIAGESWIAEIAESLGVRDLPFDLRVLARFVDRWERRQPTDHDYRQANSGPLSDTFMATPVSPAHRPRRTSARAVARARQALAALDELDGTLPDQPLRQALDRRDGWAGPARERAREVAFVGRRDVLVADPWRTADEDLEPLLSALLRGDDAPHGATLLDRGSRHPTRAAVAIGLGEWTLAEARHLHRRAWTRGGGPWLSLTDTSELAVIATCHAAIDGFGHLELARRVLPAPPPRAAREWRDDENGFAAVRLPTALAFPLLAYTFGCTLQRFFGREAECPASFQIPVAPGAANDPLRLRRRVRHALVSVRHDGREPEPFDQFAVRLRDAIARERTVGGPLLRLARALAASPLPPWLLQPVLATRRGPRRALPSIALLAGRGRLSYLRQSTGDSLPSPLYAASHPGLLPTPGDPRGSLVATAIDHGDGITASVLGVGQAATRGAGFLAAWKEQLREHSPPSRTVIAAGSIQR